MNSILIIDDDPRVVELIISACELEFPSTISASHSAQEGLQKLRKQQFDLVILDLTLPDMSGLEVCKAIRNEGNQVPVLCLTSRGEVLDRVLGLEVGADDYMTKPFSPRELIARIKAILRRTSLAPVQPVTETLVFHELRIDVAARRVFLANAEIELSKTEFEILLLLASQPGKAVHRDTLLEQALGYSSQQYEQTVTAHISRIRAKLEKNPDDPLYIRTVRGIGYRFATFEELAEL